jgi:hypothetical protein
MVDDPPINTIKCIPQKGEWQGGDEVLIIMPGPIKRKGLSDSIYIYFSKNFLNFF